MKFLFLLTSLFIFFGCQYNNSSVNECIDFQLNKYDTLQKDFNNPNRFKDAYCKKGVCKTRDQIKSSCFIKPYSSIEK